PNGSGKSTIKDIVPHELLGVYINPDEIEKELRETSQLPLSNYGVVSTDTEFIAYLENSTLLQRAGLTESIKNISCISGVISFHSIEINSYFASVIASFIREKLLENKTSFTFETVMS